MPAASMHTAADSMNDCAEVDRRQRQKHLGDSPDHEYGEKDTSSPGVSRELEGTMRGKEEICRRGVRASGPLEPLRRLREYPATTSLPRDFRVVGTQAPKTPDRGPKRVRSPRRKSHGQQDAVEKNASSPKRGETTTPSKGERGGGSAFGRAKASRTACAPLRAHEGDRNKEDDGERHNGRDALFAR